MNEKIKDILGVNEIQFRQICMIAQGAFAKFLFAKTPEKESIFREIFKEFSANLYFKKASNLKGILCSKSCIDSSK